MHETELKSVVEDASALRASIERLGAQLLFEGQLEDRRYDLPEGALGGRDHVLRLRTYRGAASSWAHIDWKGPTRYEGGYKVREELSARAGDPEVLAEILARLGYVVVREIDREIAHWELADGTTVRLERYPRMDDLVEVEGSPAGIERAVALLGLRRDGFTTDRLLDFIRRYEARTGLRAALSERERAGDYRLAAEHA